MTLGEVRLASIPVDDGFYFRTTNRIGRVTHIGDGRVCVRLNGDTRDIAWSRETMVEPIVDAEFLEIKEAEARNRKWEDPSKITTSESVYAAPKCVKCGAEFVKESRRGRPAVKCLVCRTPKVTSVATSIECRGCSEQFTPPKQRGRRPVYCTKCQEENRVLQIQKTGKTTPRVLTCADCCVTFTHEHKGRRPIRCTPCRVEIARKAVNKDNSLVCSKCRVTFMYEKRGRKPSKCPKCKDAVLGW